MQIDGSNGVGNAETNREQMTEKEMSDNGDARWENIEEGVGTSDVGIEPKGGKTEQNENTKEAKTPGGWVSKEWDTRG